MILRCDVAFRCSEINAWLIHAAIAVFHFVCLCSACECKQLIAETDAKYWFWWLLLQCPSNGRYCRGAHGRITRSIAQKYSVILYFGRISLEVVIEWHHCQTDALTVNQLTNDIVFNAAVKRDNMRAASLAESANRLRGDLCDQVSRVRVVEAYWLSLKLNFAQNCTRFPESLSQSPCVNTK